MRMSALLGRALGATVLATAALGFAVAPAQAATSLATLKAGCAEAGGSWSVDRLSSGKVFGYSCWYSSVDGDAYVDVYDRGGNYRYTG
ncbi:MAG: hypothetical protein ACT4RN_15500 [Pseudonocardia sp.]